MKNIILLRVQYDGSDYCGMQIQPNGISIQEKLENTYERLAGTFRRCHPAGRTDAGVHARGQTVHFEVGEELTIPEQKIANAFNSLLPNNIRVTGAIVSQQNLHARYSCMARRYSYRLLLKDDVFLRQYSWRFYRPISPNLLFESANLFVGKHDFTTFSKMNSSTAKTVCAVEYCRWKQDGSNCLVLDIKADRFLYGMVRSLVGTMVDVALAKRSMDEVKSALSTKDRANNSALAPASGLVFEEAYYPNRFGVQWRE